MKQKIRIDPLFPLPFLLLFYGCRPWEPLLFLLAALIHEGGHLLLIYLTGNRPASFWLSPFGASVFLKDPYCPYRKEVRILLAGPLANLLGCLVAVFFLRRHFCEEGLFFLFSNSLLGLFNLLPIGQLDGARALFALLSLRMEPDRVEKITGVCHKAALIFLICGGFFLWRKTGNVSYLVPSLSLGTEGLWDRQKKKKATKIP